MYVDNTPVPNGNPKYVVVIEADDKSPTPSDADLEALMNFARENGATSSDGDNDEIFWIVDATEDARRVWDFTESTLRGALRS